MWTKSRIFQAVKYVFLIQILALFFFSIIRIAFIAVNFPEGTPFIFSDILHALVIGVRFDNHIASYISLLPLLSAVVISLFKRIKLKGFFRILNCYYYILYTIAFLIAVSNIRYFAFFGWHINIAVPTAASEGGAVRPPAARMPQRAVSLAGKECSLQPHWQEQGGCGRDGCTRKTIPQRSEL